jgi:hypothetical protein
MKTKELLAMNTEFEAITEGIKNGEVTVEEMKEALDITLEEIVKAFDLIEKVLNGEQIEELTKEAQDAMLEQINVESAAYDKKEHQRDMALLLAMVDELDTNIGEPLFMPYITKILKLSSKKLKVINEDIAKTTKKALKKFKKAKEEQDEQLVTVSG